MLETVGLKVAKYAAKKAAPKVTEALGKHAIHMPATTGETGRMLAMGLLAGAVGGIAMTIFQKIEQSVTGRPDSYVPGHTLERMLGQEEKPDEERVGHNHAMHWGQGLLAGAACGLMADRGIRGPFAWLMLWGTRLTLDQTLENAMGVGAPPWTWPLNEQIIDLTHKAIFAATTQATMDALCSNNVGGVKQCDA
jgi:hypothetical protein